MNNILRNLLYLFELLLYFIFFTSLLLYVVDYIGFLILNYRIHQIFDNFEEIYEIEFRKIMNED
jgi:hypothetical protein